VRTEAITAGHCCSPLASRLYSCIQLLTTRELLEGEQPEPPVACIEAISGNAPKAKRKGSRGR
jgi:hypothetical protein